MNSLTWVNQGSATALNTGGRIIMTCPTEAGANFHGLSKSGAGASATAGGFNGAAAITGTAGRFNYTEWGVYLRESSTGKIATATNYVQMSDTQYTCVAQVARWTNSTTRAANTGNLGSGAAIGQQLFLRVRVSGGNVIFEASNDGSLWRELNGSPIAVATAFTTAPDESGIMFMAGFSQDAGFVQTGVFTYALLT